jgi:hypothetical protein
MTELLGDLEAHRLLCRAYGSSYRWPQDFGGFRASVYYAHDQEHMTGSLEVHTPSDVRLADGLEGADARLERELVSIVGHRWYLPYEEADGRHRLTLDGSEHPLGRLVRVDDKLYSSYRIQGGHIQQINRQVGRMRFSVNIQRRTRTRDERALPVHFCVIYWDTAEERMVRTDVYRDAYISEEGVYLPLSRRVITADDAGINTWHILLRDHRLLVEDSPERRAV